MDVLKNFLRLFLEGSVDQAGTFDFCIARAADPHRTGRE
jgi:hypothetical protein